jgi:transposase-like protein
LKIRISEDMGADLNLSAFLIADGLACLPTIWPAQKDLIQFAPPPSGTVWVNHHVYFSTEETERVIFIHGVAFAHYEVSDRAAEAYAMVSLFESGYANQKNIARAFGVSARSLHRYQERLEAGGLAALARTDGRPSASRPDPPKKRERDRTILHLKAKGWRGLKQKSETDFSI